jgi:predicted AAA+ superfamily ATPase
LGNNFDLERAINYGLLPPVYLSETPEEDLKSYIGLYLKEEIADEGLTRNVPAFSRFLTVAALCSGKIINYTKIANDAQVARSTVQEYFEILKDTLIAHELPAWGKSQKRKPIGTSKFYLFDGGVARVLQDRSLIRTGSPEFGEAFEAYVFHELKAFADYHQIDKLHYWRSISGLEVDFILDDETAIEVKASKNISGQDLKNLKALREEKKLKNYIVVCCEKEKRIVDGIKIVPWQIFLEELWA